MSKPESDIIKLGEEDAEALEKHEDADNETAVIEQLIVPSQRETDVSLYTAHTEPLELRYKS